MNKEILAKKDIEIELLNGSLANLNVKVIIVFYLFLLFFYYFYLFIFIFPLSHSPTSNFFS